MPPVATWTFPPLCLRDARLLALLAMWEGGVRDLSCWPTSSLLRDAQERWTPVSTMHPALPAKDAAIDRHGAWPAPGLLCSSIHFQTGSTAAK